MKKLIKIEGMTCDHCKKRVYDGLKEIEGITSVNVDVESKQAIINLKNEISNEEIIKIIDEIGYDVVSIEFA